MTWVADKHQGLLHVSQLAALGIDRSAIRRYVVEGTLHPTPFRGVYQLGRSTLDWEGKCTALSLCAGEGFALTGSAAADLAGYWTRPRRQLIEVIGPVWRRPPSPGVDMRCSTTLQAADYMEVGDRVLTSVPRTLLELGRTHTRHQIANFLFESEFGRPFDQAAFDDVVLRNRRRPEARVLLGALELRSLGSAGTFSYTEDEFIEICADSGLEDPLSGLYVETDIGPLRVDTAWPWCRVCAEVDHRHHDRIPKAARDRSRDAALGREGWKVLRGRRPYLKRLAQEVKHELGLRSGWDRRRGASRGGATSAAPDVRVDLRHLSR